MINELEVILELVIYIRWSKDKFKIIHIILNPNTPVMYMLNKLDKPDKIDSSVAYTRSQLLLSK